MNIYKRARGRRLPSGGAVGLSMRCPDLGTQPAAPPFVEQMFFSIHEDREKKYRLEKHKNDRAHSLFTPECPTLEQM